MNLFDGLIILIALICATAGYRKGFIKSIFDLLSIVISLVLSNKMYPYISSFIKSKTKLYGNISSIVIEKLDLSKNTNETPTDIIASLDLPKFLTNNLLKYNNIDIYNSLNVDNLNEYIGALIANLCINAIAIIIVFILILTLMKVLSSILDIFSKLPVIHQFNKLGGILIGGIQALFIVSLINIVITFMISKQTHSEIYAQIESSMFAYYFFENNPILILISEVFS